ncbi:SA1362 family protein [Alkalicoccus halolimnae]|uniref:SA1362 family protein n=1 Tax=Alkalicoccus halolimnae TaxID=1667239 RepID=A0A5C7FJB0_9BACI|nr:SA1362 family protein [Alkalicoccus halolimnae]TXF86374.1 ABC transporter ATP-binding protein [Alkalicoccus halolimnae]
MVRKRIHPVLFVVIGLAVLGIGGKLIQDPGGFITSIFVTIGIITLFILLFRRFIQPRLMQQQSGFKTPVKKTSRSAGAAAVKSKPKPKRSTTPLKTVKQEKRSPKPLIKRQSDVKLTVIEGKKNTKKKSRALF